MIWVRESAVARKRRWEAAGNIRVYVVRYDLHRRWEAADNIRVYPKPKPKARGRNDV